MTSIEWSAFGKSSDADAAAPLRFPHCDLYDIRVYKPARSWESLRVRIYLLLHGISSVVPAGVFRPQIFLWPPSHIHYTSYANTIFVFNIYLYNVSCLAYVCEFLLYLNRSNEIFGPDDSDKKILRGRCRLLENGSTIPSCIHIVY